MAQRRHHKWVPLLAVAALIAVNWTGFKGSIYGLFPARPAAELPDWRTDYQGALNEARATGKPILVDFTADWCPPCRVMEREVWPDAAVRQALNGSTVPLQLDVDRDSTQTLVRRMQIGSIPTVLLLDSEGNEIARRGLLSRSQMLDFLEAFR